MVPRPYIPIRLRYAALTAFVLSAGVLIFSAAAYFEVRRSAIELATDRLIAITTQIGQLFETSTTNQRNQVAKLASNSAIRALFRDPDDRALLDHVQSLAELDAAGRSHISTLLVDAGGRVLYTRGAGETTDPAQTLQELTELLGGGSAATSALHVVGDSLVYTISARSQAGDTVLGYVVQRRRLVSSDRELDQLSRLIGSRAVIHLGNTSGDAWTDLLVPIVAPPLDRRSLGAVSQYSHGDEGAQLAYAAPIAQTPWMLAIEFPLDSVLEPATRTLSSLALVAFAVLLTGAGASWIAGRRLTQPIAEIAAATKELRAGNYAERVPVGRRDELGDLGDLFNQMAESVAGSKAAVVQQLERIKSLRAIDLAILGSTDLQLTLRTVIRETRERLSIDVAMVMLFSPDTLMIEMAACDGMRTALLPGFRTRLGEGVSGRAALERRIAVFPDLDRDAPHDLAPVARSEGLKALFIVPLIAKGQLVGLLAVGHRTALDPGREWLEFLEALAGQAAMAIDSGKAAEALQRSHLELALAYDTTIEGWSRALDLRDKETEGHTQRVADVTLQLARLAGLKDGELVHVKRGALLHDIGKMGVPDAILHKPGRLTPDEWALMQMHPTFAYELLSPVPYLRPAIDIPYAHHEKWDGSGYPRGLKREQIPWAARLFAVIDVWDALRSDRPYREGWPEARVRSYLLEQSGKHFDPDAVNLFLRLDVDPTHAPAAANAPHESVPAARLV